MKILALDPATFTGWACWDGHRLVSGTWDMRVRRDESADFRLIRLRSKLLEFKDIEQLYFEAAGMTRFSRAAQVAGQLEGVILTWAHDQRVSFRSVKPTELKKFATGKGNAGKPRMIVAAKRLTGYQGDNDNEADARLVMSWAIKQFGLAEDQEAFEGVRYNEHYGEVS